VLGEEFLAYARLVIKTVQRSFRGDLSEIPVTFLAFGQNKQVIVGVAFRRRSPDVVVIFLADVQLAANDRLHAFFVSSIYKVHCYKDVAVIGHRDRSHAQFLHPLHQFLDVTRPIEHVVVGVEM